MITHPTSPPLLQATSLSAGHGPQPILHQINLTLQPGEFVALAGPNGSGKSTLLQTLTGHLPAHTGKITLGPDNIQKLTRAQIARRLAFVPQRTEVAFTFTALQMVLMGRHAHTGYSALDAPQDVENAMAMLHHLQIAPLAPRPYTSLSGGEQQLVLMARALTQSAPLILLDEPLTGLDLRHQSILMEILQQRHQSGHAILASFHDIPIATRWCTRIILLNQGHIHTDAPPQQAITPATLQACYHVKATITPIPGQPGLNIYVESPLP